MFAEVMLVPGAAACRVSRFHIKQPNGSYQVGQLLSYLIGLTVSSTYNLLFCSIRFIPVGLSQGII